MIDYGEKPSNQAQMDLPGYTDEGKELMDEARKWVGIHYEAFMRFRRLARRQMEQSSDGKASPNSCKEQMRGGFDVEHGQLVCDERRCVSVPNAYAPCLARIAMERDTSLKFRLAKSKVDGFTEALL